MRGNMGRKNKKKHIVLRGVALGLAILIGVPEIFFVSGHPSGIFSTVALADEKKGYQDDIAAAEKAKEELEKAKEEAKKKQEELQGDYDNLMAFIEKSDAELNRLYEEQYALETEIEETENALEQTRKDLAQAEKNVADQYEIMKRRIQYMYENGGNGDLFIAILNADSISDALNQIEYAMKITEYDNSLLERYEEAQVVVENTKKSLEAKLETLGYQNEQLTLTITAQEEVAQTKAVELLRVMEKLSIEEEILEEYADKIANKELEIEDLTGKQAEWEAEQKRLEEERKRKEEEERKRQEEEQRLREEEERKKAEEAAKQGNATDLIDIIWPLPGYTRVGSKFGPRKAPLPGASTYHKGIDVGAPTGTKIVAALAGTVEIASYSSSGGNYIGLYHGNGVRTRYLHCSKLLVKQGQEVKQGEVIGLVGSTGISTGPHLHFSLSIDGTYVDPLKYLTGWN